MVRTSKSGSGEVVFPGVFSVKRDSDFSGNPGNILEVFLKFFSEKPSGFF